MTFVLLFDLFLSCPFIAQNISALNRERERPPKHPKVPKMPSVREHDRPRKDSQNVVSPPPDGSCDSKDDTQPRPPQETTELTEKDDNELSGAASKEKQIRCPNCSFILRSPYPHKMRLDMFYHIRKVHCGDKCFRKRQACEKCNSLLDEAYSPVLEQNKNRTPKFDYPCFGCNKKFGRSSTLSDHLASFNSNQHRNTHTEQLIERLAEIPPLVQPCFGCGVFYMEKQFWIHLKVHSPICREKHEQVLRENMS